MTWSWGFQLQSYEKDTYIVYELFILWNFGRRVWVLCLSFYHAAIELWGSHRTVNLVTYTLWDISTVWELWFHVVWEKGQISEIVKLAWPYFLEEHETYIFHFRGYGTWGMCPPERPTHSLRQWSIQVTFSFSLLLWKSRKYGSLTEQVVSDIN